ncbi:hypothetical protein [Coleofasciculus sp.]
MKLSYFEQNDEIYKSKTDYAFKKTTGLSLEAVRELREKESENL